MIETLGALVGAVFVLSKVVGAVKALLFVKDVASSVVHDDREELIKQHVFMEHRQPLKFCMADQCPELA
jgi:hypothetical protein